MKERPHILIIDDDTVLCALLETMLYTRKVQVSCAQSIAAAEQCIRTGIMPDVVFLDQRLPDGNGVDYLKRLKQLSKKIKVIMMTGDDDPVIQQRALSEGCLGFLEKPFSYLKVSELLDKALRSKRSIFRFA